MAGLAEQTANFKLTPPTSFTSKPTKFDTFFGFHDPALVSMDYIQKMGRGWANGPLGLLWTDK